MEEVEAADMRLTPRAPSHDCCDPEPEPCRNIDSGLNSKLELFAVGFKLYCGTGELGIRLCMCRSLLLTEEKEAEAAALSGFKAIINSLI